MKLWKKLALAGAAACLIITAGCGKEEKPAASAPAGKVPVTVSFGAMKELTQAIGGDRVSLSSYQTAQNPTNLNLKHPT
mgnify:CR=1 FL=1